MNYIDYDNSFEIINSIVDSTNKLIPLLKSNQEINETIYSTVEQIFHFMRKALNILPEFLIADKNLEALKIEIISQFDDIALKWKNFSNSPEGFFLSWELFFLTWDIFIKSLKNVPNKNNIVFISMN